MTAGTLTLRSRLRNIAGRRAVMRRLVLTDLKVKYEGLALGYLWSVLEPLLLTAVYFFVFSFIGRFGIEHYALFLMSGILPWHFVSHVVNRSTDAVMGNAKLIKKVYLPREIFPLSLVASRAADFCLSLAVLGIVAAIYRVPPSIYLVAFPLAFLIQIVLLTGLSLGFSAGAAMVRDLDRVIKPFLRAIFYMTPILYPMSKVMERDIPYWAKVVYRLNPFVGIMDLYHAAWYPELFHGWANVGISAAGAVLALMIGWRVFTRLERRVLKEL